MLSSGILLCAGQLSFLRRTADISRARRTCTNCVSFFHALYKHDSEVCVSHVPLSTSVYCEHYLLISSLGKRVFVARLASVPACYLSPSYGLCRRYTDNISLHRRCSGDVRDANRKARASPPTTRTSPLLFFLLLPSGQAPLMGVLCWGCPGRGSSVSMKAALVSQPRQEPMPD